MKKEAGDPFNCLVSDLPFYLRRDVNLIGRICYRNRRQIRQACEGRSNVVFT